MNSQIIHFNEGDVKVEQHGSTLTGSHIWTAHKVADYDYDSSMGYGSTMLEAIADLNEKLKEER